MSKKDSPKKFKFIAGCPVCREGVRGQWYHQNCSSYEEIDEDGWIYCRGCEKYLGFILDLKYNCGFHDYTSVKDATAVFQALAMMTDAQKDISPDFANKIGEKILERLKKS